MTELPPIIERLDALRAKAEQEREQGNDGSAERLMKQWRDNVLIEHDNLRAELLRLQEERDRLLENHRLHYIDMDEAEERENALLEALREATNRLENCARARGDYERSLAETDARSGAYRFRQLIASVEGKE